MIHHFRPLYLIFCAGHTFTKNTPCVRSARSYRIGTARVLCTNDKRIIPLSILARQV
jgi:hypothetical protein